MSVSRLLARHAAILVLFPVLALGCGGGDSAPAEIALTSANAELVAANGVEMIDALDDMSGLVDGFTGVFGSQTAAFLPCDEGTLDININDLEPKNQLSSGDSASFSFSNCVFGTDAEAVSMNGGLSFVASEVTGSDSEPGPFAYVLTVSFQNLSVSGPEGSFTLNGGFTLDVSSEDGETIRRVVSGTSLSAAAGNSELDFSGSISDFRDVRTLNTTTGAYTFELDATFASSELGGIVRYETTDAFSGVDPDDPDTGTLVVTGAEGGKLTVIALDNVNVRLLVDIDGDGTAEATIDTTWDYLDQM